MSSVGSASDVPPAIAAPAAGALAGARVLVVSHGFQPNYERGFSNALADNGAAVTLVSSDRTDSAGLRRGVQALNLRGSQDAARAAWRKALNLLGYHLRLMALALRRRGWAVHVVGLLSPLLWCGIVEGLWFRLVSARYVLTVHNLLPHDRHTAWNRRLHRLAYGLPHALVVHTAAMKRGLADDFGVPPERITVMEHGIEPFDGTPPALPPVRAEGPLRLLFFGALLPYKGLDLLLQALALSPLPLQLQIAGPCPDAGLVQQLQALIDTHPKRAAIRWQRGFVPEAAVPGLFLEADALVLPYRHIDQSGVLFQALRHGTAIVASEVGAFRDYVGAQIGETCAPGDAQALAAAIARLHARRAGFDRERIREAGRRFEWPRVSRVLAQPYGLRTEGVR